MESYRGFKVGDKVEIIKSLRKDLVQHCFKVGAIGTIEESEPTEFGNYCVKVGQTHQYVSPLELKKLPNYAVGDVVRYNGKIATIDEVSDTPPFFLVDIYGEGRVWALTSELSDFDGYKVGDTVWTLKRGKGKIVAYSKSFDAASTKRVFVVKLCNENSGLYDVSRRPKTTNLIPTEAKYKEAMTGGLRVDVAFVTEYVPEPTISDDLVDAFNSGICALSTVASLKRFSEAAKKFPSGGIVCGESLGEIKGVYFYENAKKWRDILKESIGSKIQVAPSAKFKVGDAVYIKNIGHTLKPAEFPNKYIVERYDGEYVVCKRHDGFSCCYIKESDLRLWKETVLTHCLQRGSDNWYESSNYKYDPQNIKFIGNINSHDTFTGESCGTIHLYRGIKGDDIS